MQVHFRGLVWREITSKTELLSPRSAPPQAGAIFSRIRLSTRAQATTVSVLRVPGLRLVYKLRF